jgi:hypothetical protein
MITKFLAVVRNILLIFLFVILADLFLNLILPKEIKQIVGTQRSYSLYSEKFDHIIDKNINTANIWGKKKYNVITDNNGFRIGKNYQFNKNFENIAFVGDSFVWGSGLDYKVHFISRLKKNKNYINLGYLSYSPSIYYKKLKYYIEEKGFVFKKVFLFVDHTDIQDEGVFYREDDQGNIVRAFNTDKQNKIRKYKHRVKNYLKVNSFIFKFYETLFSKRDISGLLNNIDSYKSYLNEDRHNYTISRQLQSAKWVVKGKLKTEKYLDKIHNLLAKNNTEMILVLYPSATEILNKVNEKNSFHANFLKRWYNKFHREELKILNLYKNFSISNDELITYKKYFIPCDIHWNSNSHAVIAEAIESQLNY